MKKSKKILALVLAAVLLVGASVMGTMAYLTSTDNVVNTFTVGKVKITLDEAKVGADGQANDTVGRVKANEYHLLPGKEYDKDPTVHVDANSEAAWLFVEVNNGIAALEDSGNTIAAQIVANGWTQLGGSNVYYKEYTGTNGGDFTVFESFKIKDDVDGDTLATYADATVTVNAYAVQAEGFADAVAAWDATFGPAPEPSIDPRENELPIG